MKQSPVRIILILVFAVFFVQLSLQAGPFLRIESIDAETDYPKITALISLDRKKAPAGVTFDESNITVYEDGYRVNYVRVKKAESGPEHIYMVFSLDASKSLSQKRFAELKKSAKAVVTRAGEEDMIAVYVFNDSITLKSSFTRDKNEILRIIDSVSRSGKKTLLYDSLYDSMTLLGEEDIERKRLICFTDGKDEGSSVTEKDVVSFARDQGIPIYFVYPPDAERLKRMKRLSILTGGSVVSSAQKKREDGFINKLFQSRLDHYIIDYRTMLEVDEGMHTLEVRLKAGEIRDRDWTEFSIGKKALLRNLFTRQGTYLVILVLLVAGLIIALLLIRKERKKTKRQLSRKVTVPLNDQTFDYPEREMDISPGWDQLEPPVDEPETDKGPGFLLVRKNDDGTTRKMHLKGREIILGTESDCSVIVNDPHVSPKHAKIKYMGNSYFLLDMVSDKGTYLNDMKILRPRQLYDWDEIRIGSTELIYRNRLKRSH